MAPNPERLTHADLVARAVRWLRSGRSQSNAELRRAGRWDVWLPNCVILLSEPMPGDGESPDAIGWSTEGRSVVVECKTSRSDFLADRRKQHRGTGMERYYLAPDGVCSAGECDERGHGLLRPCGRGVSLVTAAPLRQDIDHKHEAKLLVWAFRRHAGECPPPGLWLRKAQDRSKDYGP